MVPFFNINRGPVPSVRTRWRADKIIKNFLIKSSDGDPLKITLVQPKSTGFMGQISKSGKAGFARVALTTLAALTPPEHDVVIHDAGNILTPFPGTALHEKMEKAGRIHDRNWANYDVCHRVIHPAKMTSEELQNGYYWAVRETYRLPHILRRIVRPDPVWKGRLGSS
jgi:hypothetical protein